MDLLKYYVFSTLCESRADDLKQKYPRDAELIDKLSDSDPSGSKKYLSWMLKQARFGARLEDLVPSVQFFHMHNQRFEKRDIGSYETLKELEDAVKSLGDVSKTKERTLAKSETEKIQETDDFVVLRIDSREAAQQYGKGTKWCITMRDASYYEQYVGSNVVFYYVLRKKLRDDEFDKVAVAVQRDAKNVISKTEFFDALDETHSEHEIASVFPRIDLEMISRDAASRPKAFLAKLMSGEDFDDRELFNYWKTLGTRPESAEAKFRIAGNIASDRETNIANMLRSTDPEWAKYIAREETKIEFEDRIKYYKNKRLHRIDGPAVEYADGSKEWRVGGKLHRIDGPAVEYQDGTKWWFIDGKLHRTDGPAVEYTSGSKHWYIDGKRIYKHGLKKYFSDDVLRKYGEI